MVGDKGMCKMSSVRAHRPIKNMRSPSLEPNPTHQVGVADAAEFDVHLDVLGPQRAALNLELAQLARVVLSGWKGDTKGMCEAWNRSS